jgi:hypothetical protein
VLKAQDYGTPQRRHRLVVVGVRRGLGVHGVLHPPPTHVIPVTAGTGFASCCPPSGRGHCSQARHCARVSCATRCSCAGSSPRAGVGFTAACAQTHRLPL